MTLLELLHSKAVELSIFTGSGKTPRYDTAARLWVKGGTQRLGEFEKITELLGQVDALVAEQVGHSLKVTRTQVGDQAIIREYAIDKD